MTVVPLSYPRGMVQVQRVRALNRLGAICLVGGAVGVVVCSLWLMWVSRQWNRGVRWPGTWGHSFPTVTKRAPYTGDVIGPNGLPRAVRGALVDSVRATPGFNDDRAAMLDRLLADAGKLFIQSGQSFAEVGQLPYLRDGKPDAGAPNLFRAPGAYLIVDNHIATAQLPAPWDTHRVRLNAFEYFPNGYTPASVAVAELLDYWRERLGERFTPIHAAALLEIRRLEYFYAKGEGYFDFIYSASVDDRGFLLAVIGVKRVHVHPDGRLIIAPPWPHDPRTGMPRPSYDPLDRWRAGSVATRSDHVMWFALGIAGILVCAMMLVLGIHALNGRAQTLRRFEQFQRLMALGMGFFWIVSTVTWASAAPLLGEIAVILSPYVVLSALLSISVVALLTMRRLRRRFYQFNVRRYLLRAQRMGARHVTISRRRIPWPRRCFAAIVWLTVLAHAVMAFAPPYDRDWPIAAHVSAALVLLAIACTWRGSAPVMPMRVIPVTPLLLIAIVAGGVGPAKPPESLADLDNWWRTAGRYGPVVEVINSVPSAATRAKLFDELTDKRVNHPSKGFPRACDDERNLRDAALAACRDPDPAVRAAASRYVATFGDMGICHILEMILTAGDDAQAQQARHAFDIACAAVRRTGYVNPGVTSAFDRSDAIGIALARRREGGLVPPRRWPAPVNPATSPIPRALLPQWAVRWLPAVTWAILVVTALRTAGSNSDAPRSGIRRKTPPSP